MAGRVPSEPVPREGDAGVRLFSLDFGVLPGKEKPEEYNAAVRGFVGRLTEQCLQLTSPSTTDGDLPWTSVSEEDGVSYSQLQVAGTPLPISRHTAEFKAPAATVLRLFSSLNYTSLIDPYTFHVEAKEEFRDLGEEYEWCHVAWTVDAISPVLAVRDFATLDFLDASRSLMVSRSVKHRLVPETEVPTLTSCLGRKSLKSRAYRVPLLYALRVVPVDGGNNSCVVTQLQWSDVGGVVPEKIAVESVEKFGYSNMVRMRKIADAAVARKVVAPSLENPLSPAWTPEPSVKIPELFS